jgi:hypothetical protein
MMMLSQATYRFGADGVPLVGGPERAGWSASGRARGLVSRQGVPGVADTVGEFQRAGITILGPVLP